MSQVIRDDAPTPPLCPRCRGMGVALGRTVLHDTIVERYQCQQCDRLFTRVTRPDVDDETPAPGSYHGS